MPPSMDSETIRAFWATVRKTRGCWLFTGRTDRDGYGRFRNEGAHRVAWRLTKGPIPDGKWVLHSCDTPACVRHLWLGTHIDNVRDAIRKGRPFGYGAWPPEKRSCHARQGWATRRARGWHYPPGRAQGWRSWTPEQRSQAAKNAARTRLANARRKRLAALAASA